MIAWLCIPLGVVVIVYSRKVYEFTGEMEFAEKVLGPGHTQDFIKLMGLALSVLAIMYVTGGLQGVLRSTVGTFFWGETSEQTQERTSSGP